ncbi:2Fe-2S iron-sulfur cluster-binding protein [Bacillus piscicola]|uniref:2Fe-2S iron-sulfur cluster-binding protein n=1 Tax=Bacillus piscicola TaxID=1632684 RepID=UPI001F096748|nr:2Fe-2S iron-sulfur cluster-binding protein [Bacillus piscicola]
MPSIHFINTDKTVEVPEESNILRMSLRHEGGLPNRCGGGICGTCVCKPESGVENLDKVKVQEKRKLGEEWLEKGYRLGCQTFVNEGDVAISWDDEVTKQVKRRKPDKIKREVTAR